MLKTAAGLAGERHFVLSTLSPGPAQVRLALAVLLGILAVFVLVAFGPLKEIHTARFDAFVPAYAMAMFMCDLITAILLYAQFSILRSRAILMIASGYLFGALTLIAWFLSFPGVFVPTNLIGGMQSTNWLYAISHGGFAIFVIAYALLKETDLGNTSWHRTVRASLVRSAAATFAAALAAAIFCTAYEAQLPRVMLDATTFGPRWPWVTGVPIALLCITALIVLWMRRRSVLDLWLAVVICLYLVELPLSYYPDSVRFSLGWYAARVIAFLSSSLVLIVLLYETTTLYGRLLSTVLGERREREARLVTGAAVSASIVHEVRQPLTAMITSADAGFHFLDRSTPNLDKAKEAFKLISADGHRAGDVIESIRATFKHDVRNRTSLDVNELIREALALEHGDLQEHEILVHTELTTQLPAVRGDRVQLQQVLLNLIANAIHATSAKDETRVLQLKSEVYGDDRVLVSIADTGPGIDPEIADRIFNPLFTTKSDGMGMGLSICRSIIESHDGQLWVAPNSPTGAVFQFTLQASPPPS